MPPEHKVGRSNRPGRATSWHKHWRFLIRALWSKVTKRLGLPPGVLWEIQSLSLQIGLERRIYHRQPKGRDAGPSAAIRNAESVTRRLAATLSRLRCISLSLHIGLGRAKRSQSAGVHARHRSSRPMCARLPSAVVTQWRSVQGGLCRTCW